MHMNRAAMDMDMHTAAFRLARTDVPAAPQNGMGCQHQGRNDCDQGMQHLFPSDVSYESTSLYSSDNFPSESIPIIRKYPRTLDF